MKKTTLKIVLLSVIMIGGFYALNHYKKMKVSSSKPVETIPTSFEIPGKSEGVSTRYYMDAGKYFKVEQNPLVRATPVEITKEDYLAAYEAYKL